MKAIWTFLLLSLLSVNLHAAKAKITDVSFQDQGNEGILTIELNKEIDDFPELTVKKNMVQVAIPGSFVWPKIEKKFSLNKNFDSKLMAYQFNKNRVRVRAVLPNSLEEKEGNVALQLKGRTIVVSFPKEKGMTQSRVFRSPAIVKEDKKRLENPGKYDESYLEKLLKEKEENIKIEKTANSETQQDTFLNNGKNGTKKAKVSEDQVNMALSGNKKEESGFSITSYVGKFAGFLALVLLLFYGVVTLLKKGAFKKGKLGFLNSTKVVEVLSTTYIAPKRSLLLIRAHNQVFLVGSSEKGLDMISEVKDMNGLFKEGEKQISGKNFDTTLEGAQETKKDFKLKEFLDEGKKEEAPTEEDNVALKAIEKEMAAARESKKAKFSDQIKNKVKELKPLQ